MTPTQVEEYNARILKLSMEQVFLWRLIEKTPISEWPKSLTDKCKAVSDKMGWCGDVQAETIAGWLRELQPISGDVGFNLNQKVDVALTERGLEWVKIHRPYWKISKKELWAVGIQMHDWVKAVAEVEDYTVGIPRYFLPTIILHVEKLD